MPLTLTLNKNEKLIKIFTAGYYTLNLIIYSYIIHRHNMGAKYWTFQILSLNFPNKKNESQNVLYASEGREVKFFITAIKFGH